MIHSSEIEYVRLSASGLLFPPAAKMNMDALERRQQGHIVSIPSRLLPLIFIASPFSTSPPASYPSSTFQHSPTDQHQHTQRGQFTNAAAAHLEDYSQ